MRFTERTAVVYMRQYTTDSFRFYDLDCVDFTC